MPAKLTTAEFVTRAKAVHGDKYDYSHVEYINSVSKVVIICKEHGAWSQRPAAHLHGDGCLECGIRSSTEKRRGNTLDFITQAKGVHGDKYSYALVDYKSASEKVEIVCDVHGVFAQAPLDHLGGHGCECCGWGVSGRRRLTTAEFTAAAKAKHGDRYDYSMVEYTFSVTPIKILCATHGEFTQRPADHLAGKGCQKCMKSGYRANKYGSFYILSCGDVTKIGITNRDVLVRVKDITASSGKDFTLEFFIKFEDGTIPSEVEKVLLKELRQQYQTPAETHDGYTECFVGVDKEALLRRVTQLCGEALSAK